MPHQRTTVTALAALLIALTLHARAAFFDRDRFLPSKHGFAFVNSFRGSPLPTDLGALGATISRSLKLPNRFGLCGGMCFAAHDNYDAGRTPPSDATPPAADTPLYNLLYARQADSIGPGITQAARFAEWMAIADDGNDGTRARTFLELPAIVGRLNKGELVHLGLVHVSFRDTHEIWRNHQVLAYAAGPPTPVQPGMLDVRIYDPNHPKRDDIVLRLHLRRVVDPKAPPRLGLAFHAPPPLGIEASLIATDGTVRKAVRGFFAMPYTPPTSPAPPSSHGAAPRHGP